MLIHLICLFGDGFDILRLKTNEHSFKAHLLTKYATSKTEHEPQGGEKANAEHCSNGIAVMAIAPNVIPRSEATWESPK